MRGRGGHGRGRGRGRGRGGRGGRSGSRGRGSRVTSAAESDGASKAEVRDLTVETDLQAYFVGNASIAQHHHAQSMNKDRYAAGMAVLQKNGVDIVQSKCL